MATFRRRPGPNGKTVWQAQIIRKGWPARYRTFDTKAEAIAWAADVETQMRKGSYRDFTPAQTTLLREILERYRDEILPKQRGERGAKPHIKVLIRELGEFALANVQPSDLAEFRDRRLDFVSSQTAKHDLAILRRILNHAAKEWAYYLPHGNPVDQIKLPPPAKERDRRLHRDENPDSDEETRLLAAAKEYGGDIHDVIVIALELGQRRGLLTSLRWEWVKWQKGTIEIPRRDERSKPIGKAPLSVRARDTLRARWEAQDRPKEGRIWPGLGTADAITRAFERVCARATIKGPDGRWRRGLEDLRFHDLRHEATSRLFERGFGIAEVAAITGHKDLKSLQRYLHLRGEDLAKKMV